MGQRLRRVIAGWLQTDYNEKNHDGSLKTMQTSYRLNARDLDQHFLESLKTLFQDKEIEIVVYEVDETAYLSKSEVNRRRLLQAIENVENGTNLIEVNFEEFE